VFGSACYVALGHLHGQQQVGSGGPGGPGTVRYCGSPLAFSFSEKDHRKSVSLVDIGPVGEVLVTPLPTPVPRPLREVRGTLDELLARADGDLAGLAGAWVKAVLTDRVRPAAPMERLREKWPHTIALDFQPEGGLVAPEADLSRLARATDPVEICGLFVEYAGGGPPEPAERQVLADAVEAASRAEAAEAVA
jgi:exonuclease SbcD